MKSKTKITQKLIYYFLSILGLNFIFILFFKEWNFTKPVYYNIFWAIHFCSIISVIIFFIIVKYKKSKIGLLIFLSLIWIAIFIGQLNPIDTYEYPHDIKIISENGNEKTVVRESRSGKTNEIEVDTVKVLDKFIFRKLVRK